MPGVPLISRSCPDLCSITQHVKTAHIRTIHVIPECQTSMASCNRVIQRRTSLEHIAHQSLLYIQFSDSLTLISTWADFVQVTLIRAHFHVSMYNGKFLFYFFIGTKYQGTFSLYRYSIRYRKKRQKVLKMPDQNVTGLVERIVLYAVSAIFLSYNGGKVTGSLL